MEQFETLNEGWVVRQDPSGPAPCAVGPRCAVARSGQVVCTYMVQSRLGCNDFRPMTARSADGGATWRDVRPMWPDLAGGWSIFGSLSRAPRGDLFFFGTRTRIDTPGEPFWSDEAQGMKQNEPLWSRSSDDGMTWADPELIPMPIPGAAEAAGPMCVTEGGRWLCCYSPCNAFDPYSQVDRGQVIVLWSDDQGESWEHTSMLRFAEPDSGAAEAWVVELSDGRLLGACWHVDLSGQRDYPNACAISQDSGATWGEVISTGIIGQSIGLAALPDGRALMIYNQRKHGEAGVYLALARPTRGDFGMEADEIIWRAATATQSGTSGDLAEWTDFSFGEPSITPLPDGTLLAALWVAQPDGAGIWCVRLRVAC